MIIHNKYQPRFQKIDPFHQQKGCAFRLSKKINDSDEKRILLYVIKTKQRNHRQMSIVQVEKKQVVKVGSYKKKKWHSRFRQNMYLSNYSKYMNKQLYDDYAGLLLEEQKKQSAEIMIKIVRKQYKPNFISNMSIAFDNQIAGNQYSPYSIIIPVKYQTYLNDELVNSFPYLSQMVDTGKRNQTEKCYTQVTQLFKNSIENLQDKENSMSLQWVWSQLKCRYLCNFDTIKAAILYMQMLKSQDSIEGLYKKYGNKTHKQIFMWRIIRCSKYFRSNIKVRQNIKISVQINDQINERTLPLAMKTWYCSLCISYDCQRHRLENRVADYEYQYISQKNKKNSSDHLYSIVKLFKFYESVKNDKPNIEQKSLFQNCSNYCYKNITKTQLFNLTRIRHKLISPLAKSLLKLGIQLFSYNPCYISILFQSKHDGGINSISCRQIFLHLVQQSNLINNIDKKMHKNEEEYLKNENDKLINIQKLKIPLNKRKIKSNTFYIQSRTKNMAPELACCMHTFIDNPSIDHKCQECACRQRGFCLASCLCTQACEIKRKGCLCHGSDTCLSLKCICFVNQLQCQPGMCLNCFEENRKKLNCCQNDQILRVQKKRVLIGLSKIPGAGLGAFAGQKLVKNDLVCIYSGQHISSDVDSIRQLMIKDFSFYNFSSPNGKSINASIDARFMGNKSRFINHGNQNQDNLQSLTVFSNGTQYVGLYAKKNIDQGEQLTFNYDGSGNLYKDYGQKYPFIKSRTKVE